MPNPAVDACPNCRTRGHSLSGASAGRFLDYYRCEVCGYVWHRLKHAAALHARKHSTPLGAVYVLGKSKP
jgi:transposase